MTITARKIARLPNQHRQKTKKGKLMATLTIDKGTYRIQWTTDNQRKSISLSRKKFSERTAKELQHVIEELIYYQNNSIEIPNKRTSVWIESASPIIRTKLAKVGLLTIPTNHTCEELWTTFFNQKTQIKPTTRKGYEDAEKKFFEFFNKKTKITTLTKEQMEQWKTTMEQKIGLAEASIAGILTKTRAVLNWAINVKWLSANPLHGVKRGSFVNRANDRFITLEEYDQLLSLSQDQEWRTAITLARIGGLRCPSEIGALRWEDIDWDNNRFYVTSSKTEHHENQAGRIPPLFKRLREELTAYQQLTNKTKGYVFQRTPNALRTYLVNMLKKSDLKIARPFDNMRASRSTEIYSKFGEFYESKWIGHSKKIACKHYLLLRDEDYTRAVVID
jgi:integrase